MHPCSGPERRTFADPARPRRCLRGRGAEEHPSETRRRPCGLSCACTSHRPQFGSRRRIHRRRVTMEGTCQPRPKSAACLKGPGRTRRTPRICRSRWTGTRASGRPAKIARSPRHGRSPQPGRCARSCPREPHGCRSPTRHSFAERKPAVNRPRAGKERHRARRMDACWGCWATDLENFDAMVQLAPRGPVGQTETIGRPNGMFLDPCTQGDTLMASGLRVDGVHVIVAGPGNIRRYEPAIEGKTGVFHGYRRSDLPHALPLASGPIAVRAPSSRPSTPATTTSRTPTGTVHLPGTRHPGADGSDDSIPGSGTEPRPCRASSRTSPNSLAVVQRFAGSVASAFATTWSNAGGRPVVPGISRLADSPGLPHDAALAVSRFRQSSTEVRP